MILMQRRGGRLIIVEFKGVKGYFKFCGFVVTLLWGSHFDIAHWRELDY